MAGKADKLKGSSFKQPDESPVDQSVLDADAAVFGAIEDVDRKNERVRLLPINDIYPDLIQPRRVIPSAARAAWDGEPTTISNALAAWWQLAKKERGEDFDLISVLDMRNTDEEKEGFKPTGSLQASLFDLVMLAASIRREGLTNPVTVTRRGDSYQLETGERRWLAFHLLRALTQDKQWDLIPARTVKQFDVWRQATENNSRSELNAIGRARQLSLLLMNVYQRQGVAFKPIDQFPHELGFYGQVSDGEEFRIPRGMGEQFTGAMGLTDAKHLRQYRRLLRLPRQAWVIADDYNLSAYRLFAILDSFSGEDQIIQAVQTAALEYGDTVPTRTVESGKKTKPDVDYESLIDQNIVKLLKQVQQVNKVGGVEATRLYAQRLRQIADEIESGLG